MPETPVDPLKTLVSLSAAWGLGAGGWGPRVSTPESRPGLVLSTDGRFCPQGPSRLRLACLPWGAAGRGGAGALGAAHSPAHLPGSL